jgi:small conductance mechanosensitive channel
VIAPGSLRPGGAPLVGEALSHWYAIPLAAAITLVVALLIRWVLRLIIDRAVRSVSDNTFARRVARAKADRDGDDAAVVKAERTAARARTVGSLLKSVISAVLLFFAVALCLAYAGIDITPLLASAGIIGIAVGFGAQSLVKDFLTGVFMIFEDQYGVGDEVDTGVAEGTVEQVGLRVTRLRDDQGIIWYVPNGSITRVGNKSQGFALAVVEVEVAYGTDLPAVQTVLTTAAGDLIHDADWDQQILDEPPAVTVESVTPDTVHVRVTLRTQPTRHGYVARELRARVRTGLDHAGLHPLRPPRTVH